MTIAITEKPPVAGAEEILTPQALAFIEELHRRFAGTRDALLSRLIGELATGPEFVDFLTLPAYELVP